MQHIYINRCACVVSNRLLCESLFQQRTPPQVPRLLKCVNCNLAWNKNIMLICQNNSEATDSKTYHGAKTLFGVIFLKVRHMLLCSAIAWAQSWWILNAIFQPVHNFSNKMMCNFSSHREDQCISSFKVLNNCVLTCCLWSLFPRPSC